MKNRTKEILRALIREFVNTAHPVASTHLLKSGQFKVSSATVRNEFAILEEAKLIHSPHVSAGKIPTEKGYRFFVDELLTQKTEIVAMDSIIIEHIKQYKLHKSKESIFDALQLIARVSQCVAFATIESDQTLYIGLSEVLRSPEFLESPEMAAQVVEILEGRERFHALLHQLHIPNNTVKICIGQENLLKEISSCAMVVTKFQTSGSAGMLGLLGPMRMNYGFNRSLIAQVTQMLV